jgi:hypothetical protein
MSLSSVLTISPALLGGGCQRFVRLHLKAIAGFDTGIDEMISAAEQVYGAVGIRIEISSYEVLELPELASLRVGRCNAGTITASQRSLFRNRNYAGPEELVTYFVDSTTPASDGCAAYPPGAPGMVVVKKACAWALAHELGHVLGLSHIDDNTFLMTGNGTANIVCRPPLLSKLDLYLINQSCFVQTY